jgi:predicted glycosyltransferase
VWLIYALGGGWGHLTRAIALARATQRERPVRILTNSPYAAIPANALPGLDVVAFDPHGSAEETRRAAIRAIAESRPAVLIVDTFPRGLGGELAPVLRDLHALRVLIHRDLNPEYVAAAGLREFVAAHYDLVLVPGAGEGSQLGDSPATCETRPWLVRSAGELPGCEVVRERLRLKEHDESCVLVCASGKQTELEWYGTVVRKIRELAPAIPVRFVAAECPAADQADCWVRYWPAMDLLSSAAVVVGGGGYNTVQECIACDVPLIARAWPRMYDRQGLRLARASENGRVMCVQDAGEAARLALAELAGNSQRA